MTKDGNAETTALSNEGCPDLPTQSSEPGMEHVSARKRTPL